MLAKHLNVRYDLNMTEEEQAALADAVNRIDVMWRWWENNKSEIDRMVYWWSQVSRLISIDSFDVLTLRNVHLDQTGFGASTVVTIDGSSAGGWQWPIRVANPRGGVVETKCIGCDNLNENGHLLCESCRAILVAVGKFGWVDAVDRIKALVALLEDERVMGLLGMVQSDSIGKYMEEAIGAIARDPHTDADGEDSGGEESGSR